MADERHLTEARRWAKALEILAEKQRNGDAPHFLLKISGGKAKLVLLNEEDASVHNIAEARRLRHDAHARKKPVLA